MAGTDELAVLGISIDITDRVKAEEAVRESEARLRQVIDLVPHHIFARDAEGRHLFVNKAIADEGGCTVDQVVGKTMAELGVPAERAERFLARDRQVLASGEPWSTPGERIVRANGDVVWQAKTKIPFRVTGTDERAVLGISIDITDRVEAEEALRASEARYRLLIENANEAITVGQDGRFRFHNPKMVEISGYSDEELALLISRDLVHHEDLEKAMERRARRQRGYPVPDEHSLRIVAKDGQVKWLLIRAVAIEWEGRPATLNFITDITERRRLEERVRNATKMEAVGQLAGGVAHEFNNLLTIIQGYSQIAQRSLQPTNPAHHYLHEIGAASDRAADLTQQLLVFGRRQMLEMETLDLNELLGSMVPILRPVAGENVDLTTALTEDSLVVHADVGQLQRMIVNLTTNARDAIHERASSYGEIILATERIELAARRVGPYLDLLPGSYVRLSVSDTGVGISSAIISRIFEPFFTTKEVGVGTGLGLPAVYGSVEQLGGGIEVESEVGKGTTVRIYIPATDAEREEPEVGAFAAELARCTGTILVVEDDEGVRGFVAGVLLDLGYRVQVASGGEEALSICQSMAGPIDLAIVDIVLPGMSGPNLMERLRERWPACQALWMSGYPHDAVDRYGVDVHALSFIRKPFDVDHVADAVREALEEKPPDADGT